MLVFERTAEQVPIGGCRVLYTADDYGMPKIPLLLPSVSALIKSEFVRERPLFESRTVERLIYGSRGSLPRGRRWLSLGTHHADPTKSTTQPVNVQHLPSLGGQFGRVVKASDLNFGNVQASDPIWVTGSNPVAVAFAWV